LTAVPKPTEENKNETEETPEDSKNTEEKKVEAKPIAKKSE
jgi:hypothetical protein